MNNSFCELFMCNSLGGYCSWLSLTCSKAIDAVLAVFVDDLALSIVKMFTFGVVMKTVAAVGLQKVINEITTLATFFNALFIFIFPIDCCDWGPSGKVQADAFGRHGHSATALSHVVSFKRRLHNKISQNVHKQNGIHRNVRNFDWLFVKAAMCRVNSSLDASPSSSNRFLSNAKNNFLLRKNNENTIPSSTDHHSCCRRYTKRL